MSSADGIWEDALYSLLGVELLPCTALWLLGQILVQLNPDPGPGTWHDPHASLTFNYTTIWQAKFKHFKS